MLTLHAQRWGAWRIAPGVAVGCNTVNRCLAAEGWVACRRPERGVTVARHLMA